MMTPMNLAIVGLGAMGKLLGGLLKSSGQRVTFLDYREDRARRLHEQGITLLTPQGTQHIDAYVDHRPEHIPTPSIVLVCVKTYQTEDALKRLSSWFTSRTTILLLQNGIPDVDAIRASIAPAHLALGTTTEGALAIDEVTVRHTGRGTTHLGAVAEAPLPALVEFHRALLQAGGDAHLAPDILTQVWSKLLVNVGINALGTILQVSNGRLLEPANWGQMVLAIREGVRVMHAKGFHPTQDPFVTMRHVCEQTRENLNSMLQDIQQGRKTEIDAINGVIAREGAALCLPTPVNAALTAWIHGLEPPRFKTLT